MRTLLIAMLLSCFACNPSDRQQAKDLTERTWDQAAKEAEYMVETAADGAVVAYRETQRVAGHADEALSDAAILASVKIRLIGDPDVSATQIDVDAKDRVITLRGQVGSLAEAQRAVKDALDTRGVERVVSYLTY
jgi:osmotically-inducible protein OsmY